MLLHWLQATPTTATACSPMDAGYIDVMIDRHDRPIVDFMNTEQKLKIDMKFS